MPQEVLRIASLVDMPSPDTHTLQLKVPLISIKHPSYFYKKNDEPDILRMKKTELTNILKP
jgi:hypothetical protein